METPEEKKKPRRNMKMRIATARKARAIGVLSIGDAIDDHFVFGRFTRTSPEDPGMRIFEVRTQMHLPGGSLFAASSYRALFKNQLVYVQSILSEALRFSGIREAQLLRDKCSIACRDSESVRKLRVVDEDTGRVIQRLDYHKTYASWRIAQFKRKMQRQNKQFAAVLVSDYQKGTIDADTPKYLEQFDCPIFIDTKNPDLGIWKNLKQCYVKINAQENERAINHNDVENLIITAGSYGAYHYHAGITDHYPAFPFDGKPNVIGAGDVFLAAFAGYMLKTQDIAESIRYANIVARASLRRWFQYTVSPMAVNQEMDIVRKLVA